MILWQCGDWSGQFAEPIMKITGQTLASFLAFIEHLIITTQTSKAVIKYVLGIKQPYRQDCVFIVLNGCFDAYEVKVNKDIF